MSLVGGKEGLSTHYSGMALGIRGFGGVCGTMGADDGRRHSKTHETARHCQIFVKFSDFREISPDFGHVLCSTAPKWPIELAISIEE